MRLSVYNLVRIITRSEFLATVAQAKYGKRTPLEKEEFTQEKRRQENDAKFKKYTLNSIANLNNKINTLVAISERNTALITNLYSELGAYKNKKTPNYASLNNIKDPTAVRILTRSKTVKGQLDEINSKLASLSQNKMPFTKKMASKKQEPKKEEDLANKIFSILSRRSVINALVKGLGPLVAASLINAGIHSTKREIQRRTGVPEDQIEGSNPYNQVTDKWVMGAGALGVGYLALKLRKMYKYFKTPAVKIPPPTAPSAPMTRVPPPVAPNPTAPTAPPSRAVRPPAPSTMAQRFVDRNGKPLRGAALRSAQEKAAKLEAKAFSSVAEYRQTLIRSRLGNALRSAGRIFGTGPQTIALVMQGAAEMASGRAGKEVHDQMQNIAKKFGIRFIRAENGTPIYEINGQQYISQNLPPEYQVILDAYIGDTRSGSARLAREKIAANPALYNSLIVQGPPVVEKSGIESSVIAAAKAATISVPEPSMRDAGAVSAPRPVGTATDLGTLPSASYAPNQPVGTETVKQIIVQAANLVGVDPAIMLAMGENESSFDPNAVPIDPKTGKIIGSAKGLFQFLNATWNDMIKNYAKQYPELHRGPFDPMANAIAGALYAKENVRILRKKKIPVTGTTVYGAHFLGAGGATKLFSAPPNALAVRVFPKEAENNPWVFKNKDGSSKTIQEIIDYLYRKVGSKAEKYKADLVRIRPPPMVASNQNQMISTPPMSSQSATSNDMRAEATSIAALAGVNALSEQVSAGFKEVIRDRAFNQPDDPSCENPELKYYM